MALGHGNDAEATDILRTEPVDGFAVEHDLATGERQRAGHGQNQRVFAGAVGAEQRRYLAGRDLDIHAMNDRLAAALNRYADCRQTAAHAATSSIVPRYAPRTFGSLR